MRIALFAAAAVAVAALLWLMVRSPQRAPVVERAAAPETVADRAPAPPTVPAINPQPLVAPGDLATADAPPDLAPAAPSEPSGVLGGTIVRGECDPSAPINVCALSERQRRHCQVSDGGRFSLEVPPGNYRILAVCDQQVAEHVGQIYVASGERVEGLVLELRASGFIQLALELPPTVEDEDVEVVSDPPSHDLAQAALHFPVGRKALTQPLGPLPVGKVHLTAHGRCVGGELDVEVAPKLGTKVTWRLEERPCAPEEPAP